MINIGNTYFYPDFISDFERVKIEEWALRNENFLIPNPSGPFRARELFSKIPEPLGLLLEIKNRIIEIEKLSDNEFSAFRGDFVSVQRMGAQVPTHIDHNPKDPQLYSRRYNVFISLPEKGGLPIYDGKLLEISEKSLLRVDSGLLPHSTTKIEDDKVRIILSYGFAIKY
jgi:hypothetical protein